MLSRFTIRHPGQRQVTLLVCYNTEADLLWVSDPVLLCLEGKPGIEHKLEHGHSNEHKRDVFSWIECIWKYLRDQHSSVMTVTRRRPDDI
jgi:hypothetical protein